MIPSGFPPVLIRIIDHLWQTTLFAIAAGLLTLLFRRNRAHIRYCLWLAASVKFLIPFSVLVMLGSHLPLRDTAKVAAPSIPVLVEEFSQPFALTALAVAVRLDQENAQSSFGSAVPLFGTVWAVGFGVVAGSWWRRWRRMRVGLRTAKPLDLSIGVPVVSSPAFIEPGVFGIFRPVLLLPDGIATQLTPAQLEAILAHELCHIRRRDNLAATIHMLVEAAFWFHPLVWWIGARLLEERERACDEEVLRMGNEPAAYAEGILKICELYLESPCGASLG
jgi:bla regulator protein blaR1